MEPFSQSWFRPNRVTRVLAVLVILAAGTTAYWLGAHSYDPTVENDGLAIEEQELDFDRVLEQRDFFWKVTLRNPTRTTIVVKGFETSCGCVAVVPPSMTLGPGEEQQLQLKIDLTRRPPADRRDPGHRFSMRLIPLVDGGLPHQGWVFSGTVHSVFTAEPSMVDFGDAYILGQEPPRRSLRLQADRAVKIHQVTCEPPLAEVRLLVKKAEEASRAFDLELTPRAHLPPGRFECELRVEASDSQDEPLPSFAMAVQGTARHDVEFVPGALMLGLHPVGTVVEEQILLRSLTKTPFRVISVTGDEKTLSWVPATAKHGDQTTFVIRQRIAMAGWQESLLRFRIQEQDKTFELDLKVAYYGKTP